MHALKLVCMTTLLLAALLVAQSTAASGSAQAQNKPEDDLRITRAVFGASQKSADVTPVVTRLVQQGIDEFYVASKWLNADPAPGQTKNLVVFYEYGGKPHVLTTTELSAVSMMILMEHADSTLRRRPSATAGTGVFILHAYYGQGRNFQEVTTLAREMTRPSGAALVLSDSVMKLRPTPANEALIVTYFYRGTRNTWVGWPGSKISHTALGAHAEAGGQARTYLHSPPAWLQDGQPEAALAAGGGRASRRELAIFQLLRAVAELEAIPAGERTENVTTALASAKTAVTEAQVNIGYEYPPADSPRPQAAQVSNATHISNAVRSLTGALTELNLANPGRGRGAAASMTRLTAAINAALTAIR